MLKDRPGDVTNFVYMRKELKDFISNGSHTQYEHSTPTYTDNKYVPENDQNSEKEVMF